MERENLFAGAGPAATRLPEDTEAAGALEAAGAGEAVRGGGGADGGGGASADGAGVKDGAGVTDGAGVKDVAGRFPAYSAAWAALAERAYQNGDPVTAYAYARTGYHRGLDQLRRAGWRGTGPVPWEHVPNRGFLRSLHMLGKAAEAIGEHDEAVRCAEFLRDSSPTAATELN